MDRIAGEFLLGLHRAARRLEPADFEHWMLEALHGCIDYDSGWWARGALVDGLPQFHVFALERQPEALLVEYAAGGYARDDRLLERTLAQTGRAVCCSIDEGAGSQRLREFVRRFGMEQALAIVVVDATPQILTGLALYRHDIGRPFGAADAALLEVLAPHLADAWTENRLRPHLGASGFRTGVLGPARVFTLLQDGLAERLRAQWPGWHGPFPPAELAQLLEADQFGWWHGAHTSVELVALEHGAALLRARASHAYDLLSPRKREVARRFAGGALQGAIADDLGLSASTVNNYLGDVYRELGVVDKAELALLVQRLTQ